MKQNPKIKKILKKRIIGSVIDLLLYFSLSLLSFIYLSWLFGIEDARLYIPYLLLFFAIYYAAIPKLSNGYTLGGFILGVKIAKTDGTPIAFWEYLLRSLYGIFSYMVFFGYIRVKSNTIGQLYFDKPFSVTVIDKHTILPLSQDNINDFSFYFLAE